MVSSSSTPPSVRVRLSVCAAHLPKIACERGASEGRTNASVNSGAINFSVAAAKLGEREGKERKEFWSIFRGGVKERGGATVPDRGRARSATIVLRIYLRVPA